MANRHTARGSPGTAGCSMRGLTQRRPNRTEKITPMGTLCVCVCMCACMCQVKECSLSFILQSVSYSTQHRVTFLRSLDYAGFVESALTNTTLNLVRVSISWALVSERDKLYVAPHETKITRCCITKSTCMVNKITKLVGLLHTCTYMHMHVEYMCLPQVDNTQ